MPERKRQKTTTITTFEQFPNELIIICFGFFNFYELYKIFFCLNQRFNQLILSHSKIHINFNSIPQEEFQTFCFKLYQLTTTSGNYPLSIQINDNYRFNLIFEDELFKDEFSRIKSLTLTNITVSTLIYVIFGGKTNLCETLERLTLLDKISGKAHDIDQLCSYLISSQMKLLKYLDLNFITSFEKYECEEYVDLEFYALSIREKSLSNLETLIIGYIPYDNDTSTTSKLSFNRLAENVLPYMPKLKTLMINSIYFDTDDYQRRCTVPSTTRTNSMISSNLKLVQIWVEVNYNEQREKENMKKYLQSFFMNSNLTYTTSINIFFIHS